MNKAQKFAENVAQQLKDAHQHQHAVALGETLEALGLTTEKRDANAAEEAQRLVDEEGVYIMGQNDVCIEGRVGRNEQGRAYHTFIYFDGRAACNCDPSFSATTDLCAHALALRLVVEREANDG